MSRKLSPDEVAALGLDSGGGDVPAQMPAGSRKLSPDEVQALGLEQPAHGPGPYRDNPTFSTAPDPGPAPGVPKLPPIEQVPPARQKTTGAQALGAGVMSGASLGFDDEAAGIINAIGKRLPKASMAMSPEFGGMGMSDEEAAELDKKAIPARPSVSPSDGSFMGDYREGRDEVRRVKDEARKDSPKAYTVGEVGGGLLTAGVGGAAKTAAGRIGVAAAEGAASGLGNSEADVTKGEVGQALKDTAVGGLVGGSVAGAGEGALALVRGAGKLVAGDLKRRVLNEVAEGTANVGQTERKRLKMAGARIVKEVTTGPDAKVVREAYSGRSAQQGLNDLSPVVDKITTRNDRLYNKFAQAGKADVDVDAYIAKLNKARKAALDAGDTRLADGIEPVRDRIEQAAYETGGLTLAQLRKMTSQAQEQAANKLGSLLERQNAKDARRVMGVVTQAMDDTLADAARGSKELGEAAVKIKRNNGRLHALLTITDALQVRARKEESMPGLLVRGAKALTAPATLGAAGALSGPDDERTSRAMAGMALGTAAVPIARRLERGITTLGIKAAQNPATTARTLGAAERFMGAMGRIGGGAFATKKKHDDDEEATP